VEVGQAVLALDLINTQLDLTEGWIQETKVKLETSAIDAMAIGGLGSVGLSSSPCSSSLFRSARESSMIRPFKESLAFSDAVQRYESTDRNSCGDT
jgi:hypothetical protein